jgi:hypothetical protein
VGIWFLPLGRNHFQYHQDAEGRDQDPYYLVKLMDVLSPQNLGATHDHSIQEELTLGEPSDEHREPDDRR